jgi:hypothetical protein
MFYGTGKKSRCIWTAVVAVILLLSACKVKHVNSEPTFEISFYKDKIWKEKGFCFERIISDNGKDIEEKCVDSLKYTIYVPLNIAKPSSRFIFTQHARKDTLEVQYTINIGAGDDEYKAKVSNFKIKYTTFESIKATKKKGKANEKENETEESIDIYL